MAGKKVETPNDSTDALPVIAQKKGFDQINPTYSEENYMESQRKPFNASQKPMMTYNHESFTFHIAQKNVKKWSPRVSQKYDNEGYFKPKQAPFTLAEIRCREQEKTLEKLKTSPAARKSRANRIKELQSIETTTLEQDEEDEDAMSEQ